MSRQIAEQPEDFRVIRRATKVMIESVEVTIFQGIHHFFNGKDNMVLWQEKTYF
nr:hypothetical protein [Streptococcus sp. S784/96/1]